MASRMGCWDGVSDVAGKTRPGLVSSSLPRGALCLLSRARRAIGRAEASQDTALFTRKRAKLCEACALDI